MRTILAIITTAVVVSAQNSVIGTWSFDETAGMIAKDSGPLGNDGTLVNFTNDPAQWTAGHLNNALTFNGTNNYVDITLKSGLPFYDGRGAAFSICMWVKGSATSDDRILSLGSSTANSPLWTLGTGNLTQGLADKLRLYIRDDSNASIERYSDATVFDDTWHHIAFVEHAGESRLYVDGVLDTGYMSTDFGLSPFTLDRLSLGAVLRAGTCCYYTGSIDELRIYGFKLSAADVATDLSGTLVSSCRGSFAEWGIGCGPGPFSLDVFGSPVLGGTGAQFTMRGGPSSGAAFLALGLGGPTILDLAAFGMGGCYLYPQNVVSIGIGPLNAQGSSLAPFPFPIPNLSSLMCQTVTFQGIGAAAGQVATSNAVLVLLGN